jgi:hypothetical protein
MPSYLFLTVGQTADLDATDAETAAYNKKWAAWIEDLAARGRLEAGAPLEWSGKVVGKRGVTELTLQEPDIGGFLVVKADSFDEALAIAGSAPHIPLGGTTIVRPCVSMAP